MIGAIILALIVACAAVRAQTGCDGKADVTFLLDSSGQVGQQNFNKLKEFIGDVTNTVNVAPDKFRVSALTFGNTASSQFYLNQFADKNAVQNAIGNIPYSGGQVKMVDAIRFATTTAFSPSHGGRNDVPHVAVLLTNQPSGSIDMIKLASQTARDNGLVLYTVGIGSKADTNELRAIASDPDSRHVYTAQNFDALSSLSNLLATKICNELPPNPHLLPAPTGCLQKADLVFVVDSSNSVGNTNFQKIEHFLKDVVTKIDVAPNQVQVGVVKYGSYPSVEFSLGQHLNRPSVMKAIEGMTYLGGGTNDADAIHYTGQQVFSQNSGARGNVPRIAVLITDGGSADPTAAIAAAEKARTENISMVVVGVGNQINNAELSRVANSPSSDNLLTVNTYDNLDSITNKIIQQMCKVKSMQPPLTTSSPGDKLPTDLCQDKETNCNQYGNDVCTNYKIWARANCARTCGFCTPLYTTAPPKCTDSSLICANQSISDCAKTGSFVQLNCPQFCGLCGTNTSSSGFYGKCSYKGKVYKTGEKWLDGCDYECICEDGNNGRYKCNNRCPVYNNLPQDCTLAPQPDSCCLKPVCNFNPTINIQQSSGHAVTSSGIDVCVYRGKQYYQRQSWRDGCDYQCTCTNATAGLYQCDDLCPVYNSIPPYCHLEQPAGECCKKPVCEFDTQSGSFMGTGSISAYGIGKVPTQKPVCSDIDAKCSEYGKDVCVTYRGWAALNCRKYCDMCDDASPSGPNDHCVYGGVVHNQGDSWNVSCDTVCTCENAAYGYYRCNNICPSYNNLPSDCHVLKRPGQCCPVVQCQNGYFYSSSANLGSLANGASLSVSNPPPGLSQVQPTLPSGEILPLGAGTTGFTAPAIFGCLYKGQLYVQDQAWEDGCEYSCVCKDASSGLYSCKHKCPSYPALPASCNLVTDRNDECCQSPQCGPDPVTHQVPVALPVFRPAVLTHNAVKPPSVTDTSYGQFTMTVYLAQTGLTPPLPTVPSVVPTGGIGYCLYNGKRYQQGELWEDGCNFNCICEDASRGHYHCLERCVHHDSLPEHCYLKTDPSNPCCDIPVCNIPVNFGEHFGEITTTLRPKGEYCVYEGQKYQQGQAWYDGCSYKCTCEDATNNIYQCLSRCLEYENVAEGCSFVPDPQDPGCCMMPVCKTTGAPNPYPTPAIPGKYTGHSMTTGYCEYKGSRYNQGQQWYDGCNLACECTDAQSGFYRCKDVCPRYAQLPVYCELVTDFTNPCCKTPRCNFPMTTGSFTGSVTPTTIRVPTPRPTGQTPAKTNVTYPTPYYKYCVYKGVQYNQGQTWQDGCDYTCRCDDADKGLYTCNQRCATYSPASSGCSLVTDPEDSCCLVPYCAPQPQSTAYPVSGSPVPVPFMIPKPTPGTITGSASRPTLKPDLTLPPLNYCEYKGQQYHLHEKWDDGCDWTCECVDDKVGKYVCTEKCPPYVNLPPNCQLVKDAAKPCCKVPDCTPTPSPPTTRAPGNTLSPSPHTTRVPGLSPSSTPVSTNMCVYKGKTYTEGQQWYDGCDYVCMCEDGSKGIYTCNDRCPSYTSLPRGCTLVPSPSDAVCCKEPKCNFTHSVNETTGFFTPPTLPTGVVTGGRATPPTRFTVSPLPLSVQPSGMTRSPTPAGSTLTPPYATGVMTPAGSTYIPPSGPTNIVDNYSTVRPTQTAAPPAMCVYKNNFYQQGQTWQDGCEYNCECLNAVSGRYRCTEMCPKYPPLPSTCQWVTDPYKPCCKVPYCQNAPPTAATVTPPQEMRFSSTPIPTPTPGCMYNGVWFRQGQQWNDGCDLQCICEDETSGAYKCRQRCNSYDVPSQCILVTDPRDSCCKVPECSPLTPGPVPPYSGPTPPVVPTMGPTLVPPHSGPTPPVVPTMGPTPVYTGTSAPTPKPSPQPTLVPVTGKFDVYSVSGNRSGCTDHGVMYKLGDKWQQGCQYNCECLDNTGRYQCTDRCPSFMNIPSSCRLETDPRDACCKIPVCLTQSTPPVYISPSTKTPPAGWSGSTPGFGTTPNMHGSTPGSYSYGSTPKSYGTTPINYGTVPPSSQTPVMPAPTQRAGCVMDGKHYVAGQTWYKDCNEKCVCEDGSTGLYRCYDRCAKYASIPTNCTLVPDPIDPTCCQVPQCIPAPIPGKPTTGPPVTVTGITGKITGTLPQQFSGNRSVCVYQGRTYTQGQRWQDGCQYDCICIDGKTGKYECTQRCASFPIVPPQCVMKRNMSDICCFNPVCDFSKVPTPFPPLVSQAPNTTSSVVQPLPPSTFCVYKGVPYKQGQSWNIGCEKKCRCDDSDNNVYTCFDRCKTYNNLGAGCIMVSDPNDGCCQIPKCEVTPTPPTGTTPQKSPTQSPPTGHTVGPTPATGHQSPMPSGYSNSPTLSPPTGHTVSPPSGHYHTQSPTPVAPSPTPVACSNPVPAAVPGVIMGSPLTDPRTGALAANIGYCEYKGSQYKQDASWEDGCSYNCRCIDASSGRYQCQEKCPRYVDIPAYCKMVQDPANKCCTKPSCNACPQTPTPQTNTQVSTSVPPVPTPQQTGSCIMNGRQYSQGQRWYVGCDKLCVCDDAITGVYSCYDRCPSYPMQAGCTMVPDIRDPVCCQVPSCPGSTVLPIYGNTTGFGTPPRPTGSSVSPVITVSPGSTVSPGYSVVTGSTVSPGFTVSPGYSVVTGSTVSPGFTVSPVFSLSTSASKAPAVEVCVYKGNQYGQGQRWQDGCQYDCVCDNAKTGHFLCTDRCPRYPNLPATCQLIHDPSNPCCLKPACPTTVQPPTAGPDGKIPTVAPYPTPNTEFCVYQGVPLRQGQTFNQGCDKTCKCEDAKTGKITCSDRCPTYPALTPNCTLVTDPADKCCQIPFCSDKGKNSTIITGVPGSVYGYSLPNKNQFSGVRNGCVYNGKVYTQGQTWDDGCTYTCECLDMSTGQYRCTQICPRFPPLPAYCTLTQDSSNKCCQKPYCPLKPTPTISPSVSPNKTVAPHENVCVYKGRYYSQGQQWYDGCDFVCKCDDANNNLYTCRQRCAVYNNIPRDCLLVPDPKDATCCQVPSCPVPPKPTIGIVVGPQPTGTITGVRPTSTSGSTSSTSKAGCVYKGTLVYQGQKFDDGCDYQCECLDNATGKYRCDTKCSQYTSLPKECILIQDPKQPCCQVPYCDFINRTPFPNGYPTPPPQVTPTPQTNVVVVAPYTVPPQQNYSNNGYCVYKSVYYSQGQSWYDECDKKCTCENVTTGYYTCKQRCAMFPPTSCPLRTDPADSCCLIPDCNTGKIPVPVYPPGNSQSTVNPIIKPTPLAGGYFIGGGLVPYQTGSGFTGSTSACVYSGRVYKQGDTWTDGCNYNCKCTDATRGQYKCTERCPRYPYLPAQCYFKSSSTDSCCQEVECSVYGSTTVTPSTVSTATKVTVTPKPSMCVYFTGVKYPQGAVWQDGCSECRCKDTSTNSYICNQRCPIYSGLPSFCTLVDDPNDQCCKTPRCSPSNGITLTPVAGNSTFSNTSLAVLPVGSHQVFSGYGRPITGTGSVIGGKHVCLYKGSLHSEGQSWEDGCDFVCSCENGTTGMYKCAAKCPHYPSLPSYCKLVSVPGRCCSSIICDIPGYGTYHPAIQFTNSSWTNYSGGMLGNTTVISVPGTIGFSGGSRYPGGGYYLANATKPEVLVNLRDKCIYKNHLYNQGEIWNIACDYRCECIDSTTGYYVCKQLCPVYSRLPSNICYLQKLDGHCCSEPKCLDRDLGVYVNPFNSSIEFPVVGTYSEGFSGFRPFGFPGYNEFTGSQRSGCYYKGSLYNENEKWEDNCDFTCTCTDQKTGFYSCMPKCPTYTNLPQMCHLEEPKAGSCCKTVECYHQLPIGPTHKPFINNKPATQCPGLHPYCYDRIQNCRDYGTKACNSPYQAWAKRNCPFTCGTCDCSQTGTSLDVCEDKLNDCKDFGKDSCSGIYESWARDNCAQFCGYCKVATTVAFTTSMQTTPSTSTPCEDKLSTCTLLDPGYYCKGEYQQYGYENCRKTCNLCGTTPAMVQTTKAYTPGIPGVSSVTVTTEKTTLSTTTVRPEESCNYKEQLYTQGQQWTDGTKSCTCTDASIGYFQCTDRCPDYQNSAIPPVCSIVQVPGRCPTVNCPPGVKFPTPSPSITINVTGLCEYKGRYYTQGQTWNDSCRQTCTCTDAASGIASCRSICLHFNNLPSMCTLLDPPQGMCCQQPKCPDNFVVPIPAAYKDQYPGYQYI